jgi:hypothetical protein
MNNPCFDVPSPDEIRKDLFLHPDITPPPLPANWIATALLTPFGGLAVNPPLTSSDELVVARIHYQSTPETTSLRTRLYLVESLLYYDFVFQTTGGVSSWYWLVSDPADPDPRVPPTAVFGPFPTSVQVPGPTVLGDNGFSYIGTWDVVNQSCDGYSANIASQAATWFSFVSQTEILSRIMNVDDTNDIGIPVLGAYYLVNFPTFEVVPPAHLASFTAAINNATPGESASPMVTLQDIQAAMVHPPGGSPPVTCTPADITAVIAGLSLPHPAPQAPAWTDQVQSFCYMMGQLRYPYYCQLYYDYTVNRSQTTVFVTQNTPGQYDSRQDVVLPLGTIGPAINYEWNAPNNSWEAGCLTLNGGIVPMSVPNFVEAGGGLCRAMIQDNPYFGPGQVTIWSVELGNSQGAWASDFWYWFNAKQQGIVFSLAPAGSLTMIDYQTFVQDPQFQACIFEEPTAGLPTCGQAVIERSQKLMLVPKRS